MDEKVKAILAEAERLGINARHPAALGAFLKGDIQNALVASTPGGIEAQEAAGQRDLVAGSRLPKEGLLEHREYLEKLGFVFGKDIDRVFIEAILPAGWSKKPTDHSMWSELLDERGRRRAGIFFKAAFYDYKGHMSWHSNGHMSWNSRFGARLITVDGGDFYQAATDAAPSPVATVAVAMDGNDEIFRTDIYELTYDDYGSSGELIKKAWQWLTENRANWTDPFLSWETNE